MTPSQHALLVQAYLNGGVLRVPIAAASARSLIMLMQEGLLVPSQHADEDTTLVYELTERAFVPIADADVALLSSDALLSVLRPFGEIDAERPEGS